MFTSQPSVMLILDSAQPAPIGRMRFPASRASRISASSDSPAIPEHLEPGEQGAVGADVVDVEDLGDRRRVRDVDAAPLLRRQARRGGPSSAASVQGPGLRRRATAAPADPRRRHDAERHEGDEHLRQAPPDPDLLDAEPLAVGEPAVGDGQILAPQAPGEALERRRSSTRCRACSAAAESPIPPSW